MTISITGDQIWTVAKYALAVVSGGAAVALFFAWQMSKAFERWW